ncbi:MAG: hypothetical protein KDA60_20570 [Planctomycetales bacterium]|nr:hypothetical protein [Planctomycetales bacterium]
MNRRQTSGGLQFLLAFWGMVLLLSFALSPLGWAQDVQFTLDLYYADPTSDDSAGSWELVARSTDRGIAGGVVRLTDVSPTANLAAPTGMWASGEYVGFHPTRQFGTVPFAVARDDHLELFFFQQPTAAPGPQGLFYDVGVPGGASEPGDNGTPLVTDFTATGIPWAFDDWLGDYLEDGVSDNHNGLYEGGVLLATGSFASAAAAAFLAGRSATANVFTSLGTELNPPVAGTIVQANTFVETRSNMGFRPGDANLDGLVDGADLEIWSMHQFSTSGRWRQGDFNADGFVDGRDFHIWLANRYAGEPPAPTVPEPSCPGWLLTLLAGWQLYVRRRFTSAASRDVGAK